MSQFSLTEENLRSLFRFFPKGTLIFDSGGSVLIANPLAEAMLGSTEAEMKGKPFPPKPLKFAGEDGAQVQPAHLPHRISLRSRKPSAAVVCIRGSGGSADRWFSFSAIPLPCPEGETPFMVVGVLEEVTDRKAIDAAVRDGESTLRTLLAGISEGVMLMRMVRDQAGKAVNYTILDVNAKFTEIVGRPREQFIGRPGSEAFGKSAAPKLAEYDEVARTRKPIHFDFTPKDKYLYISASALDADTVAAFFFDLTEKKQAEEALRASEERYKSFLESVTDYIYTVKVEESGLESTVHGASCVAVTGFTQEEYKADPYLWFKMVLDEDKPMVQDQLAKARMGGPAAAIEHRIIHKNGSLRWVRNTIITRRDAQGRLTAYDGLVADITERRRAYAALRTAKEYAEKLIQTANTMVVGLDLEGRVTVFNEAAEKISGYARDEVLGRSWFEIVVPRDRFPGVWEEFERLRDGGMPERFENPILTKSGDIRHIVWQNSMIREQGRDAGMISFGMDMTEIKRSEIALRLSEEKYRDIFERAVEGIFQIDLSGAFLDVNPAFASMLGYASPEELLQKTPAFAQLYAAPSPEEEGLIARLRGSDTVMGLEQRLARRGGGAIWASINARVVRDMGGNAVAYEGTTMDVTERKNAEAEKERLHSQLRHAQKMEAIGTFIGGVAHDFNNMLSVIIGYATLLQLGLPETDAMRGYVDQIVSSSERAASLTQSLLAFSRKQPIVIKPVDLNKLIMNTEKILRRLLTEDIVLTMDLFPLEIVVMGDSTQIDQILFNLVTNARDAMPRGGELRISTELVDLDTDMIDILGFGKPGAYALLQIADTGIGMDDNVKEHIFDPFFTTKEVGKGTGLGLSTVYGIVKQHQGYVNVYSEPSKGTVFNIYLPAALNKVAEEATVVHHMPRGKESILVAEDNQTVRDLMRTILTRYGYTIFEAVDGEDALNKVDACGRLDLMIVDSVMPKLNGREVMDELKKKRRDIKVLFTSGYTRDVVLDKGIEEQEVDFLPKPISPHSLLSKVREVLDRSPSSPVS